VGGHEPRSANVRIIAATHQNLETLVAENRFREDLFHRLNVIRLHLPNLADRREDIPLLLEHFLQTAAQELEEERKLLRPETLDYLTHLPWPGNVRQLENFCRWITVMATGREVLLEDLPLELAPKSEPTTLIETDWTELLKQWAGNQLTANALSETGLLGAALPKFEQTLIEVTLAHTMGRKRDASILLGWGRNTLTRKMQELDMEQDSSED
jgi:two-component system nitrogen regulation response regulator GlnG